MKLVVLTKGAEAARTRKHHLPLMHAALNLVDMAVAENNFAAARKLCEFAHAEAKHIADRDLIDRVDDLSGEVEEFANLFDNAKTAAARLKVAPVDSDANRNMGEYLCFVKGMGQRGADVGYRR